MTRFCTLMAFTFAGAALFTLIDGEFGFALTFAAAALVWAVLALPYSKRGRV